MKKLLIFQGAALLLAPLVVGEPLQYAKVSKVVNDVRIFQPSAAARTAKLGDTISGQTSLQTARRSRAEVRFQDETLTRIGANSIFSFERGTRDLTLEQGTILFSVPKNSGGARVRTATVTAAVTGTTGMMEYFLKKWCKIIVLEGRMVAWLELNGQVERKVIKAGQMIILRANDRRMPDAVDIDLALLLKTSALADRQVFGPLPILAQNKIASVINTQADLKKKGILINLGPGGRGGGDPATGLNPRDAVNDIVPLDTRQAPRIPVEGDDP